MCTVLQNRLLRCVLLLSIVLSISFALVPGASANVRVPSGDLPFYTSPLDNGVPLQDEWAVITFYRPPSCIPAEFNLITFFDPAAFACTPYTTEGFEIWQDPEVDLVPLVWQLHGLGAVPLYFVRGTELQAEMADGVLTIGDLEGFSSLLRGTADFYKQTVRNEVTGAVILVQVSARGQLEDGRSFSVESVVNGPDMRSDVRVVFR